MISEVKVWPLSRNHAKIKANGSFVVSNAFKVKCTVMQGEKGLFVSLPGKRGQTQGEDGKFPWYPDVQCITKDAQAEMSKAVLDKYNEVVNGEVPSQGEASGPTNQDHIPF